MMINKEEIIEACYKHVQSRIEQIKWAIDEANMSIREETKSSAGDKYETSREMIQQDLSRYQQQLRLAKQDLELLQRIQEQKSVSTVVGQGSVVQTNKGLYFVGISIGEIKVREHPVFVISLQSPIGQSIKGKVVGDTLSFRGSTDQYIQSIY